MALSYSRLSAVLLCALLLWGCPKPPETAKNAEPAPPPTESQVKDRPEGIVGYYALDDPAIYEAKSMNEIPPGQVRHLGIVQGRWLLRDMMVGFGGTWVKTSEGGSLTVTHGPTGPARDRDVLQAIRTPSGLILKDPAKRLPEMRFTYLEKAAPEGFGYDEFLKSSKSP